jgi:hypothetical protein
MHTSEIFTEQRFRQSVVKPEKLRPAHVLEAARVRKTIDGPAKQAGKRKVMRRSAIMPHVESGIGEELRTGIDCVGWSRRIAELQLDDLLQTALRVLNQLFAFWLAATLPTKKRLQLSCSSKYNCSSNGSNGRCCGRVRR